MTQNPEETNEPRPGELQLIIPSEQTDAAYLPKRKSLYLTFDLVTYKDKSKEKALIDSGATGNFVDQSTVTRLKIGNFNLASPRQVFNVDGSLNKAGMLRKATYLYVKLGQGKEKRTLFYIINLGKDWFLLGYPWLEDENPVINWKEGTLKEGEVTIKTTQAYMKEWLDRIKQESDDTIRLTSSQDKTIEILKITCQKIADKVQWQQEFLKEEGEQITWTTIAQQMAEKFKKKDRQANNGIPEEYQKYAKVFSDQEANRFPPSWEWDHRIPLKSDAPETINAKMFSLSPKEWQAIEEWVYKMQDKGFI